MRSAVWGTTDITNFVINQWRQGKKLLILATFHDIGKYEADLQIVRLEPKKISREREQKLVTINTMTKPLNQDHLLSFASSPLEVTTNNAPGRNLSIHALQTSNTFGDNSTIRLILNKPNTVSSICKIARICKIVSIWHVSTLRTPQVGTPSFLLETTYLLIISKLNIL